MLPRLLYERLDELGLDFSVLYPTTGLSVPFISNDEVRRAACRAFNTFAAEQFAPVRRPPDAGGGGADEHAGRGDRRA